MNFLKTIISFLKFNTNNSTNKIKIFAPISGKIVKIQEVPDDVFSEKIVGDGIAIDPTDCEIVAPCNGIIKIFDTNHAFSILSDEGIELFVHFGIDTVQLKGKGFIRILQDKKNVVKKGDLIIKCDLNFLKEHSKSILTPVIISNIDKIQELNKQKGTVIAGKTKIMEIFKK